LASGRAGREVLARREPVEAEVKRVEAEEAGTVSIPAPGDGAETVEGGAAPGPQRREAPGLVARRSEAHEAASNRGGGS